jgi:hypothetical protein
LLRPFYATCKYHLAKFIAISASHATTMGHIKRGDLDAAMVLVPPQAVLEAMSLQMTPLLDKQIAIARQRKTLEKLRDTLLPKNERLTQAARRINRRLPAELVEMAVKDVQRAGSPELLASNEAFHRLLTEGVPVSRQMDGDERGERVWLVDFARPENNEFLGRDQQPYQGDEADGLWLPRQRLLLPQDQSRVFRSPPAA